MLRLRLWLVSDCLFVMNLIGCLFSMHTFILNLWFVLAYLLVGTLIMFLCIVDFSYLLFFNYDCTPIMWDRLLLFLIIITLHLIFRLSCFSFLIMACRLIRAGCCWLFHILFIRYSLVLFRIVIGLVLLFYYLFLFFLPFDFPYLLWLLLNCGFIVFPVGSLCYLIRHFLYFYLLRLFLFILNLLCLFYFLTAFRHCILFPISLRHHFYLFYLFDLYCFLLHLYWHRRTLN